MQYIDIYDISLPSLLTGASCKDHIGKSNFHHQLQLDSKFHFTMRS